MKDRQGVIIAGVFLFLNPILWWRQLDSHRSREGGIGRQRGASVFLLLAFTFLLLAPDPHDHGDAGSLGGLFRLLHPGSAPLSGAQQTGAKSRPGSQQLCPIHFWQQVVATALLLALLLRFFLNAEFRAFSFILLPSATGLRSFHNRAPPILL